jgi:hypothetical protein
MPYYNYMVFTMRFVKPVCILWGKRYTKACKHTLLIS